MVTFDTRCGLGNQLFQYALARGIAELFDLRLSHAQHSCDGWTHSGRSFCLPEIFDVDLNSDGRVVTGETQVIGMRHLVDLAALRPDRPIHLSGFYERWCQISLWADKLRKEWLRPKFPPQEAPADGVIGIHIRVGDFVKMGWSLPADYYIEAAECLSSGKYVIVTDSPYADLVTEVASQLQSVTIRSTTLEEDFAFLMQCRQIVISNSTFSWWAAWLGQASIIVCTGPDCGFGGPWRKRRLESGSSVDYWPEEKRYRYLS